MKHRFPDSRVLILGGVTAALVFLVIPAMAREKLPRLRTVPHVDLDRYMGDWRVIAEIPYFAEKNCVDSIESYALRPDGTIDNWFTARKKSFDAPEKKIASARAYVVDPRTNTEWRVKFAGGLISTKYFIIDLDPDYQWAVVGHPSRNNGWIFAREKSLPTATYQAILGRLRQQGYDTTRFLPVPQFPAQLHEPNAATGPFPR